MFELFNELQTQTGQVNNIPYREVSSSQASIQQSLTITLMDKSLTLAIFQLQINSDGFFNSISNHLSITLQSSALK